MTASSSPLALLPLLLSLQQLPPSIAQGGEHDGARHKPGTPLSPPSQHFWRNDSANLALAAAWNRYYAATPYSWDVGSDSVGGGDPAISDDPPFSLEWSIGRDAPIAQKDGHGCLFRNRYFAIANGIWCYVDTPVAPDWNGTHASPCVQGAMAMAYDLHRHTWSHLPAPPTGAGRTTGACGSDSLYILSGMGGGGSVSQLTMSVDSRSEPVWSWRLLPELPRAATRWLGAAGVVDGHLVLAGGTNTRGFEFEAGARDLLHAKVAAQKPCDNATHCPPWLPSYRLYLQGAAPSHQSLNARWEEITKFPGGGMDVPNSAVVNGSLYMFGGWRANYAGMQAWQERGDSLYQLGLPVPLTLGTNGAQLLRYAYKYTVATNKWERLPDVPQHVCQGATAVLRSRYIVQIGSAHGHNSFRVGSTSTLVTDPPEGVGWRHATVAGPGSPLIPDMSIQRAGIASYYGDTVLVFDTLTKRYSRVGVAPYGLVTGHCVANDTHLACALGEPRHGWNANCETVVQIARIVWKRGRANIKTDEVTPAGSVSTMLPRV